VIVAMLYLYSKVGTVTKIWCDKSFTRIGDALSIARKDHITINPLKVKMKVLFHPSQPSNKLAWNRT
jgi:hypothetical protein